MYVYIYTTKQAIQAWSKAIFHIQWFFLTWDFTTNLATQTHREIPVFRFTSGKKEWRMFFTNMELQPPQTKKNTTCLKRMRLKLRTLLCCFHVPIFFPVATNPSVCQLPWNTKAANPHPVLPLKSLCSSLRNSHQNPIFVHYQGAIRTTWVP